MKIMTFRQVGKGRIELTGKSQYGEYKIIRHTGVRPKFQLEESEIFADLTELFEFIKEPVEECPEAICVIYEYSDFDNENYYFVLFKQFKNPQIEHVVEYMQKSPTFVALIYLPQDSLILAGNIPENSVFFKSLRNLLSEELELNYSLEL